MTLSVFFTKTGRKLAMLKKIKELADEAVALQNKNRMDEVLREISKLCEELMEFEIPQSMKSEIVIPKELKKGVKNGK